MPIQYSSILERLTNAIQEKSKRGNNWKKEVADVLALKQSAAYKRLNGSTLFSVEELAVLAEYYGLPINEVLIGTVHNPQNIPFHLPYKGSIKSFNDYISPILRDMKLLTHVPNVKIWYAANEIPIFWYFHFAPLIKFKYFMWGRITWNIEMMQGRKISLSDIKFTEEEKNAYLEVLNHYQAIDSIEFWSDNILSTTIQQIEFCVKSNLFKRKKDLKKIINSLHKLILLLYDVLIIGHKKNKGKITVYKNSITQANTCVYVESLKRETVYTIFKNPNLMSSSSPAITKETKEWFLNIKNHSDRLTNSSEQQRLTFLNTLERQVIEYTISLEARRKI